MNRIALLAFTLIVAGASAHAASPSAEAPYSGQQTRDIKALAPEDVQAYLAGKGMGLAKAAELNGYPGPAHTLALADQLKLTDEQKRRTEALFTAMDSKAKALGAELVDEERHLDRLFVTRTVSDASLTQSLRRIGGLQARVRQVHLEAHLAQVRILTSEQVTAYAELRGYGSSPGAAEHAGHQH